MKLGRRTQCMPGQCILPGIRVPIFRFHGNCEKLHFWATVVTLGAIFSATKTKSQNRFLGALRNIITFRMNPFPYRYLQNCRRRYVFGEKLRISAQKRWKIKLSPIAPRLLYIAVRCNDIKCTPGQALSTCKISSWYIGPLLWQPWKTCQFWPKLAISSSGKKNFELEGWNLYHYTQQLVQIPNRYSRFSLFSTVSEILDLEIWLSGILKFWRHLCCHVTT